MPYVLMAAYTNYRRDPRVKREAEALIGEGYTVRFLARRQPGEPDREVISGVEVLKLASIGRKPNSFAEYIFDYLLFFLMLSIHLTLHPRRYDLIHINNMPDFLALAAWLPKMLGRPIIHDVHDLMPEIYMEKFNTNERHWAIRALLLQEKLAAKFATAVLTVEECFKDILVKRDRIAPDKVTVLMNLPDERIFQPRPPQPVKGPDQPFVMVYHGTLARRLGLDIGIQAIDKLRGRIPRMEFRIIGGGEERERLIELAKELNLQGMVTFSDGFVPVEDIPGLIHDADAGLIPLRKSAGTETMLPTKLLEYVSVGIPSISPKTETIARFFDESMVRFFEAENVDSLAAAILDLYHHPEKRESLHRVASAEFLKKYRWSEHKSVYIDLVNRLLNRA
ncbi:MAG: glycosyltransferase family 4 protein [Candidatus Hydrogenedentes bacterium]|nr:glycosyltransferase family 4 protein [Candidatus Hydrogenedentota bacterium]